MRRNWLLSVGLAFLMVSGAEAQERFRSLLPNDEALARYGLARRWYGFAPIDGQRETVESATVVGDQIHLQTNQSRLHVLDAESGKLLWSAQLGLPTRGQLGSAVNSNTVFVVSGNSLYALKRDDGVRLWSIRLPQVPSAAPVADEQRIVVSTLDGRLYVYSIETHAVIWFYQTDAKISMPAVLHDDKVACASQDGMLYVFATSSNKPAHQYRPVTRAPISAPIAPWGRLILLPSEDFNLYAVDLRAGETQWRYAFGTEIRRPISVIENQVFVFPEDGELYALNAEDGKVQWRHPRAQQFVAASVNRLYAADKYGRLVILQRSTGRPLGLWDTHQFDYRALNEMTDRLYLVTRTGLVVCCHEKENKEPVVHKKSLPPPPAGAPGAKQEAAELAKPGSGPAKS